MTPVSEARIKARALELAAVELPRAQGLRVSSALVKTCFAAGREEAVLATMDAALKPENDVLGPIAVMHGLTLAGVDRELVRCTVALRRSCVAVLTHARAAEWKAIDEVIRTAIRQHRRASKTLEAPIAPPVLSRPRRLPGGASCR